MKEQVLAKAWVSGNAGKQVKRIANILWLGLGPWYWDLSPLIRVLS